MKTSPYIPSNKRNWHNEHTSAYWTKLWHANMTPISDDKNKQRRKVHFSDVTVREYEIQPSDTPAVTSGGPGIELHWKYKTLIESTPLIDFDDMRAKQRRKKFHTSRGLIPPTQRRARLLEFGFSIEEIDDAKLRLQYSVGRCCCQFK